MLYAIMHHLQNHTLPVMKINVFQNLLPWVLLRAQFKQNTSSSHNFECSKLFLNNRNLRKKHVNQRDITLFIQIILIQVPTVQMSRQMNMSLKSLPPPLDDSKHTNLVTGKY